MRPLDPVKEEKIIRAVFTITGKLGLEGVNISRISREAGIGAGSLYTYFKSKEEAIQAAYSSVEHKITRKMYEGFDINRPVMDSLKTIYMNALLYRLHHYEETLFIDQYTESKYLQINPEKQLKEFEQQNKPLYQLIRKGQKEGVLAKLNIMMMIIAIDGSIRSCYNGIVQKWIPFEKRSMEAWFQIIWKGISR